MVMQVGGGGDSVSFNTSGPGSMDTPYFGGTVPSPYASQMTPTSDASPYYGGSVPSPAAYQRVPIPGGFSDVQAGTPATPQGQAFLQASQQSNGIPVNGGQSQAQAPAAPVHHYSDYLQGGSQFGQAIGDQTYVNQKSALLNKLNDYERNIAGQVGDQNMTLNHASDPNDLLGDYWSMKSLGGDLYDKSQDVNGNFNYTDNHKLGGSMDKNFAVGLDNFNNQQQHGLRNVAEDFASRGMLGSGSGVWQTAHNNLQDQYNNQLTNMNDSTISQYNNLLAGLGDQYNQARPALTGYLGDAANRLSSASAAGLPTNV